MKKYAIFLFLVTVLFSCGKDYENPNYVEIDGQSYSLSTAFYEDYGTNLSDDVLYRDYYIELQSKYTDGEYPSTTLGFNLYSRNSRDIGDGTYYFDNCVGSFQDMRIGVNQRYDSRGYVVSGDFFTTLDPSYSNRIEIRTGKHNKIFDINLRFIKGGQSYAVIAHYEASIYDHTPLIEY